jgi:hypothetical protein
LLLAALGLNHIDIEENLKLNFQLAESWGCILLLEEADVFLAQRTPSDVAWNALVSGKFRLDCQNLDDY